MKLVSLKKLLFVGPHLRSVLLLVVALVFAVQSSAVALTPAQRRSYANKGIYFIDDPCAAIGPADITTDAASEANARAVIGIAKTYKLGKDGALIGLMTAITESHLKMYANSGIPVSMQNPVWLTLAEPRPLGNDHDSVGIMQQRISTGWSTYGNGDSQEIVWQLMDPVYAAQAFFGTPPGAVLPADLKQPSALKKGLQNLDNWQSLPPWIAAQKVQISGFADGSNYKGNLAEAQSVLAKLWDSSPPIALPIPITGGETSGSTTGGCSTFISGNLLSTIAAYAWNYFKPAPYLIMTPEYQAAVRAAQDRGEYVGGGIYPGVDCGGFVTRAMRDSGTDPHYNSHKGNTYWQYVYLLEHPELYQKISNVHGTQDLPTDQGEAYIAIIPDEHTYFYTGEFNFIDHRNHDAPSVWAKNGASASLGRNTGESWRTPMASNAYEFTRYYWFKIIAGSADVYTAPPTAGGPTL
jgi:hypothetical protein